MGKNTEKCNLKQCPMIMNPSDLIRSFYVQWKAVKAETQTHQSFENKYV